MSDLSTAPPSGPAPDLPFPIDKAQRFDFDGNGISHPVYRYGSGPGVLMLHELPGMTGKFLEVAGIVVGAVFTVFAPLFFGRPGQDSTVLGGLSVIRLCIRHEFSCLATNRTSPIADWLRLLCATIRQECPGRGIGAIGMCLTGNLVLALSGSGSVLAPVLCQPALPLCTVPLLGNALRRPALGLSSGDVAAAVTASHQVPVLGYRFQTDAKCPAQRFATLARTFGKDFRATQIPTGKNQPGQFPASAHPVLGNQFRNDPANPTRQALNAILSHFRQHLP
jgi:dienelactone hydrolase